MHVKARVLFQLARIPNSLTASADSLVGYLIAAGAAARVDVAIVLMNASMLLYAGGVILNDVADADRDRQTRPDRPIPSGAVSTRAAFQLTILALLIGVVLAGWLGVLPLVVSLCLVACVVLYDVILKQTALAPSAMGGCRALNVLLGVAASGGFSLAGILASVIMWVYVTSLTLFARREDTGGHVDNLVGGFVGVCVAIPAAGLLGLFAEAGPRDAYFSRGVLPGLLFAALLLVPSLTAGLDAIRRPEPARIQRAVKTFVLGIVVLDAAMVGGFRGWIYGLLVLAIFIPARRLASQFRVT